MFGFGLKPCFLDIASVDLNTYLGKKKIYSKEFLPYINNIDKNLTEGTKIRLFADDSLLYRTIKTEDDTRILQRDLNTLQS